MTVWLPVKCPHCHSAEVVKHGKSALGKQRYRCQNEELPLPDFCPEPKLSRTDATGQTANRGDDARAVAESEILHECYTLVPQQL